MSYAIFEIVYGIPLTSDGKQFSDELEEIVESNQYKLIQSRYSGSASQTPTFCGVALGRFNECSPVIEVSKLNMTPTQDQMNEFISAFDQMPAEVQQMIRDYGGEPRVFLLSCTS